MLRIGGRAIRGTRGCSGAGAGFSLPHMSGNEKPMEPFVEDGVAGGIRHGFSISPADVGPHGRFCCREESELFLPHFVAAVFKNKQMNKTDG